MSYELAEGDALEVLQARPGEGVDVVLCDPPYGLSFMGKAWDHAVPGPAYWAECLRVAKPGAPLLAFGGTKTFHRLMCAIEDAGWEIRDTLMWVYSSGMPKSRDIGKDVAGFRGYGTGLKPSWEPIILAMKPLDGTYAQNAEVWGVAGLNIDASRVPITDGAKLARLNGGTDVLTWGGTYGAGGNRAALEGEPAGRWPGNLISDGGDDTLTRYFYCAKASTRERTAGGMLGNNHPTVKPLALMRYLVKLTNPPGGGLYLDPFCGSGTAGMAVLLEGGRYFGIDRDPDYLALARRRIEARGKVA